MYRGRYASCCSTLLALAALAPLALISAVEAARFKAVPAASTQFSDLAREVDPRGRLTVTGHRLAGEAGTATLELERFEVWAADAVIEVLGQEGGRRLARPDTRFFRGSLVGAPGSTAMLSVHEDGSVAGNIVRGEDSWTVGKDKGQGGLRSMRVKGGGTGDSPPSGDGQQAAAVNSSSSSEQAADHKHIACSNDRMPAAQARPKFKLPSPARRRQLLQTERWLRDRQLDVHVALDTDHAYFKRFTSQQAARDYAALLIGVSHALAGCAERWQPAGCLASLCGCSCAC
jgi:hypothetical protein